MAEGDQKLPPSELDLRSREETHSRHLYRELKARFAARGDVVISFEYKGVESRVLARHEARRCEIYCFGERGAASVSFGDDIELADKGSWCDVFRLQF